MSATSSLVLKNRRYLLGLPRLLRAQSRFKIVFILTFGMGLEVGATLLFVSGFRFLDNLGGVGFIIISRLFSLFFLGLGAMLILSGGVTAYATLFQSDETPFLLTHPYSFSHIVLYKFAEALLLSSWAFFLVIIPFTAAYAWHQGLTILFPLWTLLFSLPLLVLCGGLGGVLMLLLVRWVPPGRRRTAGLAVALLFALWLWRVSRQWPGSDEGPSFLLARMIPGFTLASSPLLPSWWVSEGILALVHGQWLRGVMLWGVTGSSMLLAVVLVEWVGAATFIRSWQTAAAGNPSPRRGPLLSGMNRCLAALPTDFRAIALKDMRVFLRDPVQWSQVLVFFGLLALYFVNLRSFRYHALPEVWRNLIAFLNLFSISAVLCSLSSRFIYPQLSLEGQAYWLIGLAPTTPARVLTAKFGLALTSMLAVSAGLTWLSTTMLNVPLATRLASLALAVAISLASTGLSIGLGAVFLDLKQRNPAAIVSGFGGTLSLVLGLGFMLAVILPFGALSHSNAIGMLSPRTFHVGMMLAGLWLAVCTAAFSGLPLWIGSRSMSRREF